MKYYFQIKTYPGLIGFLISEIKEILPGFNESEIKVKTRNSIILKISQKELFRLKKLQLATSMYYIQKVDISEKTTVSSILAKINKIQNFQIMPYKIFNPKKYKDWKIAHQSTVEIFQGWGKFKNQVMQSMKKKGLKFNMKSKNKIILQLDSRRLLLKLLFKNFKIKNKINNPGSLNSTIANLMVKLSDPKPDDIFIDPFCGTGTILFSRKKHEYKIMLGNDKNRNMVKIARRNLNTKEKISNKDFLKFQIIYKFNKIVTNLPFGNQFEILTKNFYKKFFKKVHEISNKNLKMVILMGGKNLDNFENALRQENFKITKKINLEIKKLNAKIFVLEK